MNASLQPIVLYVEDDDSDRLFMSLAFTKAGLSSSLRMVSDGRAAIEYLSGTEQFADRSESPVPHVILLDLNLPEVSGFEVLEWIRHHPQYARMPVVILTSSAHPNDRVKARSLGADEFWQKPSSALHYSETVTRLCQKWLPAQPSAAESSSDTVPWTAGASSDHARS